MTRKEFEEWKKENNTEFEEWREEKGEAIFSFDTEKIKKFYLKWQAKGVYKEPLPDIENMDMDEIMDFLRLVKLSEANYVFINREFLEEILDYRIEPRKDVE